MRMTERGERYVVYDDFLPPEVFDQAVELMERSALGETGSVISAELDGPAHRTRGTHFPASIGETGSSGRPAVFTRVTQAVRTETGLFGAAGTDWDRLTFTFWQYPANSRLGWHNDAGRGRRGEYIVYLHREWDISWGGELMLIDQEPRTLLPAAGGGPDPEETTASGSAGLVNKILRTCERSPVAVLPRPNRLVMVMSDTLHTIRRVDHTAGENRRCSLTGFAYLNRKFQPDSERNRDLARNSILNSTTP
ncbi:2OG-Fe(II) oxygenase [Streptomyces sp. NBC_00669]|uniref:2OG-Fe(II) oxygenase n=1 Tax=Streptomyces sp. NBC_00669 TaxID=2976011 RepID=UPI002E379D3E|nr:2OG-Fe(II) oxygenase [Streptomyces sp. NBC_00669]